VRSGDLDEARRHASTRDDWQILAGILATAARHDEAIEALCELVRLDPADTRVRASLARTFVARGDAVRAAEYLTAEMTGDDPALLLAVCEIQLRAGRTDDAVALARVVIGDEPSLVDEVARLGLEAAPHAADAGFRLVGMATDAWADQAQWRVAAATLKEFVQIVPNHVPALVRLVEIGVDGGLPSIASHAQAHLTDTYIAAGAATEALVAAEDLAQREPWNPAHIERLRQALRLTGESNPDAAIAQRLSREFALPREPFEPQADSTATRPTIISFPKGAAPARRARR
jgi:tetratricopeptide (TPR) repeat protein